MKYRVLPAAQSDLEDIDQWVLSKFGEVAANEAIDKLYEAFGLLSDFQNLGIRRPDVTSKPVRFFSLQSNWIIYSPGEPLLIHRIYPARMDIGGLSF